MAETIDGTVPVQWRCAECRALLGIQRGEAVEIKYKVARYTCKGTVTAQCRCCGAMNARETVAVAQPAPAP